MTLTWTENKKNMKRCSKIRAKKDSHVVCGFCGSGACKCYLSVWAIQEWHSSMCARVYFHVRVWLSMYLSKVLRAWGSWRDARSKVCRTEVPASELSPGCRSGMSPQLSTAGLLACSYQTPLWLTARIFRLPADLITPLWVQFNLGGEGRLLSVRVR